MSKMKTENTLNRLWGWGGQNNKKKTADPISMYKKSDGWFKAVFIFKGRYAKKYCVVSV